MIDSAGIKNYNLKRYIILLLKVILYFTWNFLNGLRVMF